MSIKVTFFVTFHIMIDHVPWKHGVFWCDLSKKWLLVFFDLYKSPSTLTEREAQTFFRTSDFVFHRRKKIICELE